MRSKDGDILEQSSFFTWVNNINLNNNWINAEFYSPNIVKIEQSFLRNNNIRVMQLNQIAEVNRVTGFEVEKHLEIVENGIPYLRVKNINECYVNYEDMQFIPEEVHRKFNKSQFSNNDIALTITGRVGTAAIISDNKEYNACQDVVKISVKENAFVNSYYLVIYFNTKYNHDLLNRFNSGGSRPRTLINNVRMVNIPIPSYEVQEYIGNKVKKAEKIREEAERLKEDAEVILNSELEISILQENIRNSKEKFSWINSKGITDRMDGEFYKTEFVLNNKHIDALNSKGIRILKLKDIIDKGSYGILPSTSDYGQGEVILLRSTNLKDFLIDDSDVVTVPEKYYKEKVKVNKGDILLEVKGQCKSGAVISSHNKKIIINGSIYRFSVKKNFNSYYILAYLLSESGQLQKQQNLANSIISYLSLDCINNLKIPVLTTEKQEIIGEKYKTYIEMVYKSKQLIQEAKQDVKDLIEGNFRMQ